ncbi:MAG: chromate transporter [Bilifractor sp.]|jgi:chromate transporter
MIATIGRLFWEFFKTGLFSVGGGLATLPFIQAIGKKTGWFTTGDVANMIAISESTPGPMGVNMATYTGYTTAGVLGGLLATMGLILPSIVIIILIANILEKFKNSPVVTRVFYGLRPASCALISAAGIGVVKIALLNLDAWKASGVFTDIFNWKCILLAAVVLVVYKKVKHSPIFYIIAAGAAGIVFKL